MKIVKVKDYLSFQDISEYLKIYGENFDLEDDKQRDSLIQSLLDLIKENKLTSVFHYDGLAKVALYDKAKFGLLHRHSRVERITGYLDANYLAIAILSTNEPQPLHGFFEPYKINQTIEPFNDGTTYNYCIIDNTDSYTNSYKKFLNLNDLKFLRNDLDTLFKADPPQADIPQQFTNQSNMVPEEFQQQYLTLLEELTQLKSENQDLLKRVSKTNNKTQDEKLIAALAILLTKKSNKFNFNNNPNKSAIRKAISDLADDFQISVPDRWGLSAADKRISECLKNFSELINELNTSTK